MTEFYLDSLKGQSLAEAGGQVSELEVFDGPLGGAVEDEHVRAGQGGVTQNHQAHDGHHVDGRDVARQRTLRIHSSTWNTKCKIQVLVESFF